MRPVLMRGNTSARRFGNLVSLRFAHSVGESSHECSRAIALPARWREAVRSVRLNPRAAIEKRAMASNPWLFALWPAEFGRHVRTNRCRGIPDQLGRLGWVLQRPPFHRLVDLISCLQPSVSHVVGRTLGSHAYRIGGGGACGSISVLAERSLLSCFCRNLWCADLRAKLETVCPCDGRASGLPSRRATANSQGTRRIL